MIAAMNVDAAERPNVPITTVMRKINGDLTTKDGMVSIYATIIIRFKTYMSRELNRSLPTRTDDGSTHNCNVMVVPRSSSLTKERESPLIAAKNTIIHKMPADRLGDTVSPAVEKRIIESVTTTNIISEFSAYRVLSSLLRSLLNIATAPLIGDKIGLNRFIFKELQSLPGIRNSLGSATNL